MLIRGVRTSNCVVFTQSDYKKASPGISVCLALHAFLPLRKNMVLERARYLAGLKGYVTNIDADTIDGQQVVAAYRDLYQVERSFRDGQVRPRPHGRCSTASATASTPTGPSCSPRSRSLVRHKHGPV
jgi:hypothetical protein